MTMLQNDPRRVTLEDNHGTNGNGNGNGHQPDLPHFEVAEQNDMMTTFKLDQRKEIIEQAVRDILVNVGEDPDREGLLKTPHRVAKAYFELLEGYTQAAEQIIGDAMFDVDISEGEMVVVADIPYSSMCEHHMLPFVGKAYVAYIPSARVVGLSKIPRIVDMFARRLQVQERMTNEIADTLDQHLNPQGVIVMIEGQHSCAALRGVKKHGVNMVTVAKRGAFKTDRFLQEEFYRLIGR